MERTPTSRERVEENYASYVADFFRTLRQGSKEAHGRAALMEFNYLVEKQALRGTGNGVWEIDFDRIVPAIRELNKELLEIEAAGDRSRAEAWFERYGTMPAGLTAALAAVKGVPFEIAPVFSFADRLQ